MKRRVGVWRRAGSTPFAVRAQHKLDTRTYRAVVVAAASALLTLGCNDDEVVAPARVRAVAVAPAAATIEIGESVQLTATVTTARARTSTEVTWASSAPNVATVSDDGEVIGVAEGTAVINAKSVADPSKLAAASIAVTAGNVRTVVVEPNPANVVRGKTLQLKAVARNGSLAKVEGRPIAWITENPQIATVSETGLITAIAFGTTEVRATIDGITGIAALNVGVGAVDAVIVPASMTIVLGETAQLEARPMDAAGNVVSQADVNWLSEAPSIVSVSDDGEVTGLALGTALIKARAQNAEAQVAVTVVAPWTLGMAPRPAELEVGKTAQLVATVRDGGAIVTAPITWLSDNPALATVSANGLVTAVAPGAAPVAIVARTIQNGTRVVADTVKILIKASPVGSLTVTVANATIEVGETIVATAVIYDKVGGVLTDRAVTWSSDKPAIAAVNANGEVTGVAAGTAKLTAACDGFTATIEIKVVKAAIASVSLTPSTLALFVAQSASLTLEIKDRRGALLTDRDVVWYTTDAAIVSVPSAGVALGVNAGTATVTADVEGRRVHTAVTVAWSTDPIASVIVRLVPDTLGVGQQMQAWVWLYDARGYQLTNRAITWSSTNVTFATVSNTGIVTGIAAGNAMIRATSEGRYGEARLITIGPPPWLPGEQQPIAEPTRGAWEIGPHGFDNVVGQTFMPTADRYLGYVAFPVHCPAGAKLSVVIKKYNFMGPVIWGGVVQNLPTTRTGSFSLIQVYNPITSPNGIKLLANTQYAIELSAIRPFGVWSNCGISKGPAGDSYARGAGYRQQPSPWFHLLPGGEDLPFITYVR